MKDLSRAEQKMIKFSKVTKKFGKIVALEEVAFEVAPEEFVFITGPTGSGKTTLFKLITAETLPTEGEVEVNQLNVGRLKPTEITLLRRKIGVVFQDLKLLTDQTVYENVAMALKVLGRKELEVRQEVENALDLVGLTDRAQLFPSQLAGGELQRTCIARAIVSKPELLIADEPTGNLDPAAAWQIINLLKEINRLGRTVVVATHNVDIVNSLKERVIEMEKGKLVSDRRKGNYRLK